VISYGSVLILVFLFNRNDTKAIALNEYWSEFAKKYFPDDEKEYTNEPATDVMVRIAYDIFH
jgi:hypothetical protein